MNLSKFVVDEKMREREEECCWEDVLFSAEMSWRQKSSEWCDVLELLRFADWKEVLKWCVVWCWNIVTTNVVWMMCSSDRWDQKREQNSFVFLILYSLKKDNCCSYERINSHWIVISLRCLQKVFLNLLRELKEDKDQKSLMINSHCKYQLRMFKKVFLDTY